MKKKLASVLLCAVMLLSACGCASGEEKPSSQPAEAVVVSDFDFVSVDEWQPADGDTVITLCGDSVQIAGDGASCDGNKVTIADEGTYVVSGTLSGQLIVDADKCNVRIVLSGAQITCENSSPIYVRDAKNVYVTLADGTENTVTDDAEYVPETEDSDEPDAAIFSRCDLIFDGGGMLTVNANYKNGIRGKDDVEFLGGSYFITAVNNGVSAKDSLAIRNGKFTVSAGNDAIKTTNDTDAEKGWMSIADGEFNLSAGDEGIQAETTLSIAGGIFEIITDSGSAIKSGADMVISGGSFNVSAADDGVHCGGRLEISDGQLELACGNDGVHSKMSLSVSGGTVNITQSQEGMESAVIDISGGDVSIVANDDGINASGDSEEPVFSGVGEGDSSLYISISGGNVRINASGDGVDSNGGVFLSGGNTYISGPADNGNSAIDFATGFTVTGGTFAAFGSSGMAQNAGNSTTQATLLAAFAQLCAVGTQVEVTLSDGTVLYSGAPEKAFSCVQISSPAMKRGDTVIITFNGEAAAEIELSSTVTTYGNQGFGGPMGDPMGDPHGNPPGNPMGEPPGGFGDPGRR